MNSSRFCRSKPLKTPRFSWPSTCQNCVRTRPIRPIRPCGLTVSRPAGPHAVSVPNPDPAPSSGPSGTPCCGPSWMDLVTWWLPTPQLHYKISKYMMTYDDLWWFMMTYDDLWWFMMIYDDLWWFTPKNDEIVHYWLVGQGHPSEKYDFVTWDDDYFPILMGNKIDGNQTTNQIDYRGVNELSKNRFSQIRWVSIFMHSPYSNGDLGGFHQLQTKPNGCPNKSEKTSCNRTWQETMFTMFTSSFGSSSSWGYPYSSHPF